MNTELIICPEYQAEVFETQAADKGCEIISKRPDGFDNFAYEVKGQAMYNEGGAGVDRYKTDAVTVNKTYHNFRVETKYYINE